MYEPCTEAAQYPSSLHMYPAPTTLLLGSASHVENNDAATLQTTQVQHLQ